jgi:hypothetical protein
MAAHGARLLARAMRMTVFQALRSHADHCRNAAIAAPVRKHLYRSRYDSQKLRKKRKQCKQS